jgi:glucosamine--fructose-6-phosphate aminotransferase (isomerizing)
LFSPLITAIPGELFSAYRSDILDEPFFRNFGGGRSIEGGGGISRIRESEMWQEFHG